MKLFTVLSVCSALLLASACTDGADDTDSAVTSDGLIPVTLSFSDFQVTEDALTRATDVSELCTRLDVWVTDQTYTAADTIQFHQASTDSGFGSLTCQLYTSHTYRITAVAHKADGAAGLSGDVLTWPNDRITQTFLYDGTFQPAAALTFQLSRIVGMFRLETTDAIPDAVSSFRFFFPQAFTRYVIGSGPTTPADRTTDIALTSRRSDGTAAFTLYLLAGSSATDYDVTVTASDASGSVIQERTIAAVPIKANSKTTAKGCFFSSSAAAMSFQAEDWQGSDDVSY